MGLQSEAVMNFDPDFIFSGTWEWPLYDSFEFLRLSMQMPWPAVFRKCDNCDFMTNRSDKGWSNQL